MRQTRQRLLQAVPGLKVIALPTDISREEDVDRLSRAVGEAFPRLDILVNCAGVAGPRGTLQEADWEEWKKAITINLLGTTYMIRAFLPALHRSQRGKIINISGGGATRPLPGLSSYAASKAAVVRLTETLAYELSHRNIDVNAVAQSNGISGRLISAVWDPWKAFPQHRHRLMSSDIYTLRRIVPEDRGISLEQPEQ